MEIIIIYFVIFVLVMVLKNKAKQKRPGSTTQNFMSNTAQSKPVVTTPVKSNSNDELLSRHAIGTAMHANPQLYKSGEAGSSSSGHSSTTEYLDQKAKLDQIEHAKEKREENRRVSQKYGGRPVGGRYLIGDPVPNGHKIFICPYCAAENIVPQSYHYDKDCYFCHEHLQ